MKTKLLPFLLALTAIVATHNLFAQPMLQDSTPAEQNITTDNDFDEEEFRFFLDDDEELDMSMLSRAEEINQQDEDDRPVHEKVMLLASIYAELAKEHFSNHKEIYAAAAAGLISGVVLTLVIQKILKQRQTSA